MKRSFLLLLLCFVGISVEAQRVTVDFHETSMSEALLEIERQSTDCRINFIYDELEDFTVTQSIDNCPIDDALRLVAGFYPIRITRKGRIYSVECVQNESMKVKGRILDERGHPLSMASIALLDMSDSTFVNGGVSNNNGDVVIPCDRKEVIVKVSFMGYKTLYKPCTDGVLGTVRMEADVVALQQIKVNGQKQIVKAEKGIFSYNIPLLLQEMPVENAYEALTRIPGVFENHEGLCFAGRPATLIINGKPTAMTEEQVVEHLKNMPADMVASAEVIVAAPARYHVQGLAINVVTKDYVGTHQTSGQIQGVWKQSKYGIGQGKGNLIYSRGNLALDAQYSYTNGKYYAKVEHEAEHPFDQATRHYEEAVENRTDILKHEMRFDADYAFSENHRLGTSYTGTWEDNQSKNSSTGTGPAFQHGNIHYYIHNVDVNYRLPFGLKLNASYMNYQNPRSQNLDGKLYDIPCNLSTHSKQNIGKWLLTADQMHDLRNKWELSYGFKMQISNNVSYQITEDVDGKEMPSGSSKVDYQERILSPYAGVTKQFNEHLSMDASATVEQYHTPKWNEWRVYPSLNTMWKVNGKNILNLSANAHSVYPSYWSIMNSVYYSSVYSEIWGNPDLKPSSNYELDLTWQFNQKYMFTFFALFNPDYFVQLPYQPTGRMAVIMKETNYDYSNQYGLQVSATFSAGKWFTGNMFATGYYRKDKSSHFFDLPFDRGGFTEILSATLSAKLLRNQNLRLILNPFFQSHAIQGVYDIDPAFKLAAQLNWTSRNNQWNVVLSSKNITNCALTPKSVYGNQNFVMRVLQDYRSVSLTATYKIGNYKARKHEEIDTSRMGY